MQVASRAKGKGQWAKGKGQTNGLRAHLIFSMSTFSRVQMVKMRQAQLLEHATLVRRCMQRVPAADQTQAFRDLAEHVETAHDMLLMDENEDDAEPNLELVSLMEEGIISAREMLTLDDATFGWSLLECTEEQVYEQVLAMLS